MTDPEILIGLLQKDKLLYERTSIYLWKTFAPKMVGMILKNSGTREDAYDMFSATFMKVQKNVIEGNYKQQNQFAGYFMTIAKHTWLDELRRRAREKRRTWETLDSEAEYLQILDAGEADIVEYALFNEKWFKIHQIWQQWDDSICKKRLTQFHLNGLSIRQIAELESTKEKIVIEDTMKHRLVRCRDKFKLWVQKLGG